jgi:short-subunit dehydrogenase
MNKWALVTGASSGIGAALARVYAEERHNVILVARREQKLLALAEELRGNGVEVHVIPMDLSHKKSARQLFKAVQQLDVHVDVLVNNAGFTYLGRFVDMDLGAAEDMMQLNLGTLVALTHLFARPMIAAGGGRILNLSSTTAFQPMPGYALYAAGKALILSFSEALFEELKGTGVSVTVLCPGPTESEMIDAVQAESNIKSPSFMVADARAVAKEGFDAANRGEALCVPGLSNKITTMMVRQPPRWLIRTMFGLIGRKMIKEP